MEKTPHIAVIGAGVVGLSTAICIQNRVPSAKITIFADKLGGDTLSSGAAGLYRPEINIDPDKENVIKWCKESLQQFRGICESSSAGEAGVQLLSGYHLSSTGLSLQNDLLKELLPVYRKLSDTELKLFPPEYKFGVFYTTIVADCRYYLPWLKQRFEDGGGRVEIKHVTKLSEFLDDFHIVVNCTGMGAKYLLNDHMLVPIRGQTIRVKAPWIKHFYYGDGVYIVPGLDYVTLGGVKDYGSWDMTINPYQKQFIWDGCVKLVPSLQNSEGKSDWVGLRPYRPSIRIDANLMQLNGKYLKVVNNYGHGSHGITLSWGTANDAAKLVEKLLTEDLIVSKL